MSTSQQVELSDPPGDAVSAVKFAPGSSTRLIVSSWDRHVHLYDTAAAPSGTLIRKFEHRAPVLDVCFGADDREAFTAGLDHDVRRVDLETGEQTVLSTHEFGVRSVLFSPETSTVISASWDKTLHVHSLSDPTKPPATIPLPYKPFSMSLTATKLVVAMAARALHIYDLQALALVSSQAAQAPPSPNVVEVEPWQRRESSLKFMTRAVACMPDDAGYASSSIEGRVAVEWFDPSGASQARKYAFKCHRQANSAGDGVDVVYPVNALAFHPVQGTFASGGGDGIVALWDGIAKRRIKQYQRFSHSIAALAFSADGSRLAIASCPGFEDGKDDYTAEGQTKIFLRRLAENEARAKGAK